MKRKAEGIYLSTKRQGVTCPHGVTSQKTVSIKSNYIQLGTEHCNHLMEQATEPCHPAVVLLTEKSHLISLCYIQIPYSWLTTASNISGWFKKNSSNSTGKMFSTTLMITSLTRPINRPYPSSSSTKRSLQLYQMLRVYKACINIQILFSVSLAVTITTIGAWNNLFTMTLKLIRHNEISELSCPVVSPTIGN